MPRQEVEVPESLRKGLITALCVITGFSFIFFFKRSMGAEPWTWEHTPPFALYVLGAYMLLRALYRSLNPDHLTKKYFKRTVSGFILALVVVFLAFGFAACEELVFYLAGRLPL